MINWIIKKFVFSQIKRLKSKGKYFDITGRDDDSLYMRRYFLLKSKWVPFEIYIHEFHRSDNDTPHDHPWWFVSYLVDGSYIEYRYFPEYQWYHPTKREKGSIAFRRPTDAHKVILSDFEKTKPITIVIKGKKSRSWGFYTAKGWIPHTEFLGI